FLDHVLSGHREIVALLHSVMLIEVATQSLAIGGAHVSCGRERNFALAAAPAVKAKTGAAFDADIADAKEQRACRLAAALDPEQLARTVEARHNRIVAREVAAHSVGSRRPGSMRSCCKGG